MSLGGGQHRPPSGAVNGVSFSPSSLEDMQLPEDRFCNGCGFGAWGTPALFCRGSGQGFTCADEGALEGSAGTRGPVFPSRDSQNLYMACHPPMTSWEGVLGSLRRFFLCFLLWVQAAMSQMRWRGWSSRSYEMEICWKRAGSSGVCMKEPGRERAPCTRQPLPVLGARLEKGCWRRRSGRRWLN